MKINGIVYIGIKTNKFDELVHFYGAVLGLKQVHNEPGFAAFSAPNGDKIEVYGPNDPHGQNHNQFTTGPVPGFEVEDIEESKRELESKGIQFIGSIHGSKPGGSRWAHFRGPDGNVYELKQKGSNAR